MIKVEERHKEDLVDNYWKLADLYANELNDTAKALSFCQQVLAKASDHKEALALKEKLSQG